MPEAYFDTVSGDDLHQGDIISGCQVYSLAPDAVIEDGGEVPVFFEPRDIIVMSQTCDLVKGREKNPTVVVCAVPTMSQILANEKHALKSFNTHGTLVGYKYTNYHPLGPFASAELSREFSVVHFGHVYTLPIPYLRSYAMKAGLRLRLKSPYREHLSQRFSFFFARVALEEELALPVIKKPDVADAR